MKRSACLGDEGERGRRGSKKGATLVSCMSTQMGQRKGIARVAQQRAWHALHEIATDAGGGQKNECVHTSVMRHVYV